MVKCPKCGEELNNLTQILDVREINTFFIEHGEHCVDNIDYTDIPDHEFEVYECSFCGAELFRNLEEAKTFLMGGIPDKPQQGSSGVGVF